jgi:hypothetical protein
MLIKIRKVQNHLKKINQLIMKKMIKQWKLIHHNLFSLGFSFFYLIKLYIHFVVLSICTDIYILK